MAANKGITDDALIEALRVHASNRRAAKALGINVRTLERRRKSLVLKGYSPDHDWTRTVPDGYMIRGVSTLYDKRGEVAMQWVKSARDHERLEQIMREALDAISDEIPREKPVKAPKLANSDLLNCYVITDYHLGMLSWPGETGEAWDMKIAEDLLVAWFAATIASAPNSETAIFAQLGDFLHWDGLDAVTPQNKNLLDADTRFSKLVHVAIRVIRRVVRMLLEKHQHVHLIMAEGNHDPASSVWLRELFSALYDQEPRITVDTSADPYYCYEFGKTALFFHHGHKRRPQDIETVFIAKFREIYGRTKYAYAHMGHMHHARKIEGNETNLMTIEQDRTLAAKDAFAARGGWLSGRSAKCRTYHREFGKVGEIEYNPEMVQAA